MDFKEFKEILFARGKEYGFSDMELYQKGARSFDLRVFKGEIDHYAINEDFGVSFRGIYEGKPGYAYTEKLDQSAVEMLLEAARANAKIIDKEEETIYQGGDSYQELESYDQELTRVTPEDKIKLIKSLEQEAFALDDRITAVNYCLYSDQEVREGLTNTKGVDLSNKNNLSYIYLSVVAREKDEVRTASRFYITRDFNQYDVKKTAREAVEEAVSLFGAKTIVSREYPVVLRYDVAADLLATFSSTFSAENVQKGLSLFKDKLGRKVAADIVTIVDDPFYQDGIRTTPFDAEGVATSCKNVVEQGKLKTYLHNLKTARKDGVQSTGNAYRSSYKGPIGIAPTNMYIKPGISSYQDLINSIDEGIIIINVQGLHSGANPVSGDFSLGAYGYYVKQGKIQRPVEQITIAGNFMELLEDIEGVGNDFTLSLPEQGHFGSPSLKVKKLAVAGD